MFADNQQTAAIELSLRTSGFDLVSRSVTAGLTDRSVPRRRVHKYGRVLLRHTMASVLLLFRWFVGSGGGQQRNW